MGTSTRDIPTNGTTSLGAARLVKGFVLHPWTVAQHLWAARIDLWAYSMSSGGLGLFTPLSVMPLLVMLEIGATQGTGLRTVPWENFGVMLFVAPLSVLALASLTRQLSGGWLADHLPKSNTKWLRSPRFPLVIAALLGLNAIAWGAVWIPQVPVEWLRTSTAASSALDQVERVIPSGAEVVASQGVMGRLCGREWCYKVSNNGTLEFPLHTANDYFVMVPFQGIELADVQTQLGMIDQLAGPLHAQLLLARDGVWLFRFARPLDTTSVVFKTSPTEPAWAAQTATGTPLLDGPPFDWAMTLTSAKPGYVLYGTEWNLLPGTYQTTLTMASDITTEVEVWDAATNTLLSRQTVPPTNGHVAIQSEVRVAETGHQEPYSGWGPFSFQPGPSPGGDRIEIRVWTKGRGEVRLYNVEVQPYRP